MLSLYFSQEVSTISAVLMNGTTRFKFKQEECSIYGFEAVVDDQLIIGEIKEKEEALNAYVSFLDDLPSIFFSFILKHARDATTGTTMP